MSKEELIKEMKEAVEAIRGQATTEFRSSEKFKNLTAQLSEARAIGDEYLENHIISQIEYASGLRL